MGPTFGYAFFFSVAPQYPQATPAILAGVQKVDKYLVNPGMVVLLLAGIGLLSASDGAWDTSDVFVGVGFLAIFVLVRAAARVLPAEGAGGESDGGAGSESGDTLSPEFEALGDRIGKVGALAGIIVVVTIFFMTYKPFL